MVINAGNKLPVQKKSINGGLNKFQRDSMGDTGTGNLEAGQGQIASPNFYNDMSPVDQQMFYKNVTDRENTASNMGIVQGSYVDNVNSSMTGNP